MKRFRKFKPVLPPIIEETETEAEAGSWPGGPPSATLKKAMAMPLYPGGPPSKLLRKVNILVHSHEHSSSLDRSSYSMLAWWWVRIPQLTIIQVRNGTFSRRVRPRLEHGPHSSSPSTVCFCFYRLCHPSVSASYKMESCWLCSSFQMMTPPWAWGRHPQLPARLMWWCNMSRLMWLFNTFSIKKNIRNAFLGNILEHAKNRRKIWWCFTSGVSDIKRTNRRTFCNSPEEAADFANV